MNKHIDYLGKGFRKVGKDGAVSAIKYLVMFLYLILLFAVVVLVGSALIFTLAYAGGFMKVIEGSTVVTLAPWGFGVIVLLGLKAIYEQGRRAAGEIKLEQPYLFTDVLQTHCGGIYKRIDQNRELLELIQNEAPEFLEKNGWVELWIQAEDEFLGNLATFVPANTTFPRFPMEITGSHYEGSAPYPRPWPGKQQENRGLEL